MPIFKTVQLLSNQSGVAKYHVQCGPSQRDDTDDLLKLEIEKSRSRRQRRLQQP